MLNVLMPIGVLSSYVITFYFVSFVILAVFLAKRCEVTFSGIVHIRITAAKVQYFFEKG